MVGGTRKCFAGEEGVRRVEEAMHYVLIRRVLSERAVNVVRIERVAGHRVPELLDAT